MQKISNLFEGIMDHYGISHGIGVCYVHIVIPYPVEHLDIFLYWRRISRFEFLITQVFSEIRRTRVIYLLQKLIQIFLVSPV